MAPNQHGALLEPSIYRDSEISCIYLVEDIEDMLVPSIDVPPFDDTLRELETVNQLMVTPKKAPSFTRANENLT